MFRLFIDYPINASSTEEAVFMAKKLCDELLLTEEAKNKASEVSDHLNYRLGHDEDRQNRNYFVINSSGHASTKKTRISLKLIDGSDV
jgi:hypothetical protein